MPQKITENSILAEILEIEGTEEILRKHKVPCLSCPMAKYEISQLRISDICKLYKINLPLLLKELNEKK